MAGPRLTCPIHDHAPGIIQPDEKPAEVRGGRVAAGLDRLDDRDYPAFTMGQAAQLLEVQPAFLRSLDAAGVLTPQRSGGGHRRYSRRQLELATRMRELFDQGMTLDATARIVELQDQLDTARARIAELESELETRAGPADEQR
jgi:MerR family transcriptional regulator, heat shock protein HspR